jgi:hypothetical protein
LLKVRQLKQEIDDLKNNIKYHQLETLKTEYDLVLYENYLRCAEDILKKNNKKVLHENNNIKTINPCNCNLKNI